MYSTDVLFLVSQMRHRELIREAERERLYKLALNNQADRHGSGLKILETIRAQFPGNVARGKSLHEQHRISNSCCTVTES